MHFLRKKYTFGFKVLSILWWDSKPGLTPGCCRGCIGTTIAGEIPSKREYPTSIPGRAIATGGGDGLDEKEQDLGHRAGGPGVDSLLLYLFLFAPVFTGLLVGVSEKMGCKIPSGMTWLISGGNRN